MTERPQVTVESLKTGEGVVRAVVRTPDRDTPLRVQPLGVGRYLVEVGTRRLTVTLASGSTADWGQVDGHTVRWPHATQVGRAHRVSNLLSSCLTRALCGPGRSWVSSVSAFAGSYIA